MGSGPPASFAAVGPIAPCCSLTQCHVCSTGDQQQHTVYRICICVFNSNNVYVCDCICAYIFTNDYSLILIEKTEKRAWGVNAILTNTIYVDVSTAPYSRTILLQIAFSENVVAVISFSLFMDFSHIVDELVFVFIANIIDIGTIADILRFS